MPPGRTVYRIQEGQSITSGSGIDNLVDARHRKVIFWTVLVEGRVVNTHPKLCRIFLWHQYWVSHPGGLFDLADETSFTEFVNFFSYCSPPRLRVSSRRLFHRFCFRIYIERVLGEFPGNSRHVCRTPGENSPLLTEELDERAFLCAIKSRGDDCGFRWIRGMHLNLLRTALLEFLAGRVALRDRKEIVVRCLLEFLGLLLHSEGFGDFVKIPVALMKRIVCHLDGEG